MRTILAKRVLFPIIQIVLKNRCWDYYKVVEESQWYSPEEIQELQWKKLKELLEHAYENVPLYHQAFEEAGLKPGDINHPDDMSRLPIMTKEIFRENYPHNTVAKNVPKSDMVLNNTSGSTGSPFQFMMSRRLVGMRWAYYIRGNKWVNLDVGERFVRLWGVRRSFKERVSIGFTLNMKTLSAFGMDEEQMQKYVEYIKKHPPKIIEAYASAATRLAMFINSQGIRNVKVGAVITSGETLPEAHRKEIELAFNCEVFNRYGCREFGAIAHECSEHTGLHLNAESFFIEFVEDEQTANTGLYKIILTNLENYAMPFIRYDIGDMGRPSDKICTCGRGLPLIAEPYGRIIDLVMSPSGRMISVHYITLLFGSYNEYVKGFQANQTKEDTLEVLIVPTEKFNQEISDMLRAKVQDHTGSDMQVVFKLVDDIPQGESGKRAILRNLVAKNNDESSH